jgi:MFS family permease
MASSRSQDAKRMTKGTENRKWWTLAAVSFGLFMIMLDNTVVNVALPVMQATLGLDIAQLEWVVTGYALTFGAFMLTGGKLADLLGRRLIFVVGLVVFTPSSLACGLAGDARVLIGARVVQGLGAAMMNPPTLSIITATFPPRQRGTAIGIWAGVSALALAIGPLVGGLITEHITGAGSSSSTSRRRCSGSSPRPLHRRVARHLARAAPDVPGLVTSALGLFALTYGLIEAKRVRVDVAADPRLVRVAAGLARRVRRCSSGTSGCRCST